MMYSILVSELFSPGNFISVFVLNARFCAFLALLLNRSATPHSSKSNIRLLMYSPIQGNFTPGFTVSGYLKEYDFEEFLNFLRVSKTPDPRTASQDFLITEMQEWNNGDFFSFFR